MAPNDYCLFFEDKKLLQVKSAIRKRSAHSKHDSPVLRHVNILLWGRSGHVVLLVLQTSK